MGHRRLTGFPLLLVGACVLVATLLQSLQKGALAPICIALLCAGAVALVRSRWTVTAVLLGLACIEPHVAMPPILAAFILVPQLRIRLALTVAVVLAISMVAGGFTLNLEYLTATLPAHAASELGTAGQYGLSAALHSIGFSDRMALAAGSVQYAIFVAAGICLVRALKQEMPASVILGMAALAATGGTFMHVTQVVSALPFAFLVTSQARTTLAWCGLALLAIPWQSAFENGIWMFAGLVLLAVLAYQTRIGWIWSIFAAAALSAGLWYLAASAPPQPQLHAIPAVPGVSLAEVAWRALADQFPPTALSWLAHLLTYAGVACTLWSAVAIALGRAHGTNCVDVRTRVVMGSNG